MKIIRSIKAKLANRNFATKIKYLREQGYTIGENTRLLCYVSSFGSEPYMITIVNDCLISHNVNFFTHDGGVKVLNSLGYFNGQSMDKVGYITIGNNCFIGNGVKIMPGVNIGDNVIVGTRAIVTKNVPSNSVVAGVPAKVICTIDEYYQKNADSFVPTGRMNAAEKKQYILNNVK